MKLSRASAVAVLAALAVLALCLPAQVLAQAYPNKPVRIVVPYTPGGSNDVLARLLGQKLSESWNVPVLIENRPGAGGNIGTDYVAKAPGDGYTLLLASNSLTIGASMPEKLPFDAMKDFKPVVLATTQAMILVASPDFAANNVAELVTMARASPGKLTYATPGNGTPHHLAGELFKSTTKTDLLHVPFKGAAPALADTVAGRVSVVWATFTTAGAFVSAKKLKILGVATPVRLSSSPEIPTFIESGVAGFDVGFWYGLMAPAGTSDEIVAKLGNEFIRILRTPDVAEKLQALGFIVAGDAPARFAEIMRSDLVLWGRVVKEANIRAE